MEQRYNLPGELILSNWNKAVKLWDDGKLFRSIEEPITISGIQYPTYTIDQSQYQHEYATLCVTWLIPYGMVEPHCVAQGE